jgi:isopenicillin-N epimerase
MRYLTDRWATRLEKHPRVKILTSRLPNQSWGLANISLEGVDTTKAYETLWSKYRIITAAIKHAEYQGLRVTPNIYSTLEEIDTFGDAIEDLLKNGVGTA